MVDSSTKENARLDVGVHSLEHGSFAIFLDMVSFIYLFIVNLNSLLIWEVN